MQAGYVDPESLLFASERIKQVREVVRTKAEALATLDAQYSGVFRQHPFYPTRDVLPALRRLLAGPSFKQAVYSL
jgi:3-methyladenine DNA glycosylase/8-oxoguanine DNA glycosylase